MNSNKCIGDGNDLEAWEQVAYGSTIAGITMQLTSTKAQHSMEHAMWNALISCGVPRDQLFITTKLYSPSTSYVRAKSGIEKSRNLVQTEY